MILLVNHDIFCIKMKKIFTKILTIHYINIIIYIVGFVGKMPTIIFNKFGNTGGIGYVF